MFLQALEKNVMASVQKGRERGSEESMGGGGVMRVLNVKSLGKYTKATLGY